MPDEHSLGALVPQMRVILRLSLVAVKMKEFAIGVPSLEALVC